MITFTTGPWRVFNGPGAGNVGSRRTRVWTANGDHLIAECHHSKTLSVPAQQANARLVAAAPALLEALIAAKEHLEYCGYGDRWERECARDGGLIEKIDAALTAATVNPRVAQRADSPPPTGDLSEPV